MVRILLALGLAVLIPASLCAADPIGLFENSTDVGKLKAPGKTAYSPEAKEYRLSADGDNIWAKVDAFHFAWRKASGDMTMTADIGWVGAGKKAHRKAGWMVRQGLDADAPYADAVIHGDGLIALQYRKEKGGITLGVNTTVKGPATLRFERHGDVFSLEIARKGEAFQPVGAVTVKLTDPVQVGLVVSSHDIDAVETAIFTNVGFENVVPRPGQVRVKESTLEAMNVDSGERRIVLRAKTPFEAPNWSRDGKLFYINSKNAMFTVPTAGGPMTPLDTGSAKGCNNDHGLSPDGKWLAISHYSPKGSTISIVPSTGGTPRNVTPLAPSYWHGWSPDGKTLAFCGKRGDNFDIYTIPVEGGEEKRLTTDPKHDDGPDYTPDGKFIYWNSDRSGLMKIWRMNADGSNQEQVTKDDLYADWFPHPSPDGKWLLFLSFDKSVTGHPPNQDVVLRLMPLAGGKPKVLATLFGGQGTINVPSWSPDSKEVAFVSYRLLLP